MFPIAPTTIRHTMRTSVTGALGTDPVAPERAARRPRRRDAAPTPRAATFRRRPAVARRAG